MVAAEHRIGAPAPRAVAQASAANRGEKPAAAMGERAGSLIADDHAPGAQNAAAHVVTANGRWADGDAETVGDRKRAGCLLHMAQSAVAHNHVGGVDGSAAAEVDGAGSRVSDDDASGAEEAAATK